MYMTYIKIIIFINSDSCTMGLMSCSHVFFIRVVASLNEIHLHKILLICVIHQPECFSIFSVLALNNF